MKRFNKNILYIFFSIILGSIIGILTVIGQKFLPNELNSFANSGAVWLLPAYYISSIFDKKQYSILSCFLCLVFSVLGYYVFEAIYNNHNFSWINFHFYLWCICSIIGGVIFGLGANISKQGKGMFRYYAMMLLPSVFLAEAIYMIVKIEHYTHMIGTIYIWVFISIILYFINAKRESFKLKPFLSFLIISIGGILGLFILTLVEYVIVF